MALDNAQFPSELSIVDPPGTDPLSEGDDQIRTAKRVVFQGFEFVDKAVTKTADQMNDGAQRSEVNDFTANQTFSSGVFALTGATFALMRFVDESAAVDEKNFRIISQAGVFSMQLETDAGSGSSLFFELLNTGGNVTEMRFAAPFFRFNSGEIRAIDGDAAAPAYAFATSPSSGFYKPSSGVLAWGVSGGELFRVSTSAMTMIGVPQIRSIDGTSGAPAYAFVSNTSMGMFINASNHLSFTGRGSAADFIIKRITGVLNYPNIQSGNAGLVSGDLFESSGFIAIVP